MKRFYKNAAVSKTESGFAVLLDGRGIKTPAGRTLVLPTERLAQAIAGEWGGQGEEIKPASMPLLRLANAALDGIAENPAATVAAILRFGDDDLLCYRASDPALAMRQGEGWDPLLSWAGQVLGAPLKVVTGVTHAEQQPHALAALRAASQSHDAFVLAGLHVIASITGSLVLALAVMAGHISAARAFTLSRIDETFQARMWGADAAAEERAACLAEDVAHAALLIELTR
jgi:chaperone required for assembly of F1-ATPase